MARRCVSVCVRARVNLGSTEHKRCGCPVSVMIDDETMVVNKLLFSWALVFTTFEVVIVVRRFRNLRRAAEKVKFQKAGRASFRRGIFSVRRE